VKEDVTQIVLNVKKLRLKSFAHPTPVQLKLIKERRRAWLAPGTALLRSQLTSRYVVNAELARS